MHRYPFLSPLLWAVVLATLLSFCFLGSVPSCAADTSVAEVALATVAAPGEAVEPTEYAVLPAPPALAETAIVAERAASEPSIALSAVYAMSLNGHGSATLYRIDWVVDTAPWKKLTVGWGVGALGSTSEFSLPNGADLHLSLGDTSKAFSLGLGYQKDVEWLVSFGLSWYR